MPLFETRVNYTTGNVPFPNTGDSLEFPGIDAGGSLILSGKMKPGGRFLEVL